jgi:ABC-type multidrug transport system ATPase subunit
MTGSAQMMLRFDGLCKAYGGRLVLDRASLGLGCGVFALQGANGIGKSTLLSLLAGSQSPDAGDIWIEDLSLLRFPIAAKRRLSYVPDQSPIYPFISGENLLAFVAKTKRCRVDAAVLELAQRFGLNEHFDTPFGVLSLGTQKKFMLAAASIGEPSVQLLDEPSNGLDIAARATLAELLRGSSGSRTVLLTTHDADFVAMAGATVLPMERLLSRDR